jgi:hypothetical protein
MMKIALSSARPSPAVEEQQWDMMALRRAEKSPLFRFYAGPDRSIMRLPLIEA